MRVKRELVARGLVTFVIAREIKIRAMSFVRPVDLCFQASRGMRISKVLKKISRRVASRLANGERFEFLCSPTGSRSDRSISTDRLADRRIRHVEKQEYIQFGLASKRLGRDTFERKASVEYHRDVDESNDR